MMVDLQTILGIIFGVGGVGAITVLVTSYRRLKAGKISDEESIIKRMYAEIHRQDERIDEIQNERDEQAKKSQCYQEYAAELRLQLIQNGITPIEMKAMTDD